MVSRWPDRVPQNHIQDSLIRRSMSFSTNPFRQSGRSDLAWRDIRRVRLGFQPIGSACRSSPGFRDRALSRHSNNRIQRSWDGGIEFKSSNRSDGSGARRAAPTGLWMWARARAKRAARFSTPGRGSVRTAAACSAAATEGLATAQRSNSQQPRSPRCTVPAGCDDGGHGRLQFREVHTREPGDGRTGG